VTERIVTSLVGCATGTEMQFADFLSEPENRLGITPWCNGNTAPFGGVILGSNPSGVASARFRRRGCAEVKRTPLRSRSCCSAGGEPRDFVEQFAGKITDATNALREALAGECVNPDRPDRRLQWLGPARTQPGHDPRQHIA
jgi:hypothetical protein